jgi:hypothetical protein
LDFEGDESKLEVSEETGLFCPRLITEGLRVLYHIITHNPVITIATPAKITK